MSRRVSARVKRKTTTLQESEQQPARRRRRVEGNEEQADLLPHPASPPYAKIDDLIERVTNAVLQKLQNSQFTDNVVTGNVSLPGTASAVQGSVDAEPVINELSGSQVNTSEILNSSDQASTAAAAVQGSVATVLESLSESTSLTSKPKDIFVSTDIPIDMTVSDRLNRKIWANEYVDLGLLLNNKKKVMIVSIYAFQITWHHQMITHASSWSQIKSQNISIQLKCGSQPTNSLWVSTHRNTLLKPAF